MFKTSSSMGIINGEQHVTIEKQYIKTHENIKNW